MAAKVVGAQVEVLSTNPQPKAKVVGAQVEVLTTNPGVKGKVTGAYVEVLSYTYTVSTVQGRGWGVTAN